MFKGRIGRQNRPSFKAHKIAAYRNHSKRYILMKNEWKQGSLLRKFSKETIVAFTTLFRYESVIKILVVSMFYPSASLRKPSTSLLLTGINFSCSQLPMAIVMFQAASYEMEHNREQDDLESRTMIIDIRGFLCVYALNLNSYIQDLLEIYITQQIRYTMKAYPLRKLVFRPGIVEDGYSALFRRANGVNKSHRIQSTTVNNSGHHNPLRRFIFGAVFFCINS